MTFEDMGTKSIVHFTLTGHFNPVDITSEVGLIPNKTWRIGESIQGTLLSYKHDGWRISTETIECIDLIVPIVNIITIIKGKREVIADICKRKNIKSEISCAINMEGNSYPSIFLEKEIIKQLYELDVNFDIDLY